MADADNELHDLTQDACQNHYGAELRDQEPRMPFGHVVMLHSPSHAHEAHDIKGHESEVEAEKPTPKCGLAPALVEPEAERLREPVGVSGKHPKQHAADDHVMKMGDLEKAVVQHEIRRHHSDQ